MGSYDGAKTCELYIPSQLQYLDIDVGLYRDDQLAITNQSPKQPENKKKIEKCKLFKRNS